MAIQDHRPGRQPHGSGRIPQRDQDVLSSGDLFNDFDKGMEILRLLPTNLILIHFTDEGGCRG